MADWVTNKVEASEAVLRSFLTEDGKIDFNMICSFKGSFEWEGIYGEAERCAKAVMAVPVNGRPFGASDIYSHRGGSVARELNDEGFEQFIQMLRNIRNHGYTNHKDFAYEAWGTTLSACDQSVNLEAGYVSFQTGGQPVPLLKALSAKHPTELIRVSCARHHHEVEGACGIFVYKGGQLESSETPENWIMLSAHERSKWIAFARELTGISDSE